MNFFATNRWLERQTVGTHLKIANLLTSGTVIIVAGALLIGIQLLFSANTLLNQTRAEAKMVSENLGAAMIFHDASAAGDILTSLNAVDDISSATLYDAGDTVFATYRRRDLVDQRVAPRVDSNTYTFSPTVLTVTRVFEFKEQKLGTLILVANLRGVYERTLFFILLLSGVFVISMAIAHAVLVRLQRMVTVPLIALTKVSDAIANYGDFSLRAEVNPSADIGVLAVGFNSMLDRIEKRESELKNEIGRRQVVESRLEKLAHFDHVTNLPNRNFFNDRLIFALEQAAEFHQRLIVMFIDLDNFKAVNDTLGHDAGDQLLKKVSERLADCLRLGDSVSRIGGDEFAIILENVHGIDSGQRVAEKCLNKLSSSMQIGGHELHISASIGIAMYPDHASELSMLLKYSDTAMYFAKSAGKNTYKIFTPSMHGVTQRRFDMESDLRKALEQNQFVLHYQPKLDLVSHKVIGFEALIRWQHPTLGMVSPLEFIALAEDTGLIVPIGRWILQTACAQLKEWVAQGMTDLTMAVNLSGRQLHEDMFVRDVTSIVTKSGVTPGAIELELTESMLMDASAVTLDKLDTLRALGIALSIDDFGTGYSSMAYLKRFPVTTLKIDRSFVKDLETDPQDVAITKAIIVMAETLGLRVVAEGIETDMQEMILIANGCKCGQGFLYSRPIPADQMASYVKENELLQTRRRPLSA